MIRILLLDDHAVVRAGYRQLIDAEPDMQVLAEAATSPQACELLSRTGVDLAVVDLSLRGDSGIEAIRRLRERRRALRVLVCSMHAHEGYITQALRAGASGYLTKDSEPEEMLQAIRRVMAGRTVLPPGLATLLPLPDDDLPTRRQLEQLTPREFEILRLMSEGLLIDQVASALRISEKTVHNTMSLVRQKLEERSDFRLCRLVLEQGVVRL
ncbi:response regulator (plasmid) [Sphaerotilus natans]|jgi:DNA-binding NarL/FixJ family response regulator|uniref:Two-component response regulator n=1 Tax=Sphaerotilus natans subsp. natans DSM 6575 TaxID=1286631 RepID=A0A059KGH0_9BURK|nr:response regulator transcription factor [Sphaerotilus natans]KDB50465.1 two-component response regulator [Sphaerotilus natans subsp. natans DSM 6575]SIR02124.1 two component transcriptional regulator, LuxR family [Sphaerotilus natans]